MGARGTDWQFADDFDERRRALLTDPQNTFDAIIDRLSMAHVVCARWTWMRDDPTRVRAEFELLADDDVIDLFHNGTDGYRARYRRDVNEGEAANRQVLVALTPAMVAAARDWGLFAQAPGFPDTWAAIAESEVARSLNADGAKVWISERALDAILPNWWHPDAVRHELRVPEWMAYADDAVERYRKDQSTGERSMFAGTRAFRVNRLNVMGAFIVPRRPDQGAIAGKDPRKRATQIHERGFT